MNRFVQLPPAALARLSPRTFAALAGMLALLILLDAPTATLLHDGLSGVRSAAYHLGAYNRTIIIPDFFDDGFARRALPGTIARLVSRDYVWSGVGFTIVSAIGTALPVTLLVFHLARAAGLVRAALLTSIFLLAPHTLRGWAADGGRTDVFIVGSLAWTALAGVHRRYRLGALAIAVGLLAHEAVVFYGVCLLAAMMWHDRRSSRLPTRGLVTNLAFLGGVVLLVMIAQRGLSHDPAAIARRMGAVAPRFTEPLDASLRDIAIYFATAEGRGVRTAMCWNYVYNRQFFPLGGLCLVTIGLYCPILLMWRERWLYGAVTILPFLMLSIVGNDVGRWLMFAVANAWLMSVFLQSEGRRLPSRNEYVAAVLCFVPLLFTGVGTPFAPNWGSQQLVARMGFTPPDFDGWMKRCDPAWHDVVEGRATSAP